MLSLTLPPAASPLPGIGTRWRLDFRFERRRLLLEAPGGGGGHQRWEFTAPQRGLYTARGPRLALADPFGFARTELDLGDPVELLVPPGGGEDRGGRPVTRGNSDLRRQGRSLRRNELLIESRPYHPGDDLRRLNWKALARTDELLVRIGEEMPPERRRVTVVVDPGWCSDRVAEATASLVTDLTLRGYRVTLVHGQSGETAADDSGGEDKFGAAEDVGAADGKGAAGRPGTAGEAARFLAALWEVTGEPAAGVELRRLSSTILVTPRPRTAEQRREVASLVARGSLRLHPVACEEPREEKKPIWKRLLFLPERRDDTFG